MRWRATYIADDGDKAMQFKDPLDLLDFSNKVVLVTGSSVGIGAGIAKRFGQAGAEVVIHYSSHAEEAQKVASDLAKLGGKTLMIRADVSDRSEVQTMADEIIAKLGRIDVLVNNAGVYPHANLVEMTEAEWDETIDVNLKGVFLCTQAAAKQMIERGEGGSIINISSIEAVNPAAGHSHYTASKAGVMMFTMTAALELGPHNIRVNAVAPGLINAPQLPTAWPEGLARWLSRVPLNRVGEPEDIGDACLFLASDAARWITGAHLIVDGGILTNQIY
jgi:NAD(P)-dependent dehydrogenase (short-subunit alcohol dehydrogenase family)